MRSACPISSPSRMNAVTRAPIARCVRTVVLGGEAGEGSEGGGGGGRGYGDGCAAAAAAEGGLLPLTLPQRMTGESATPSGPAANLYSTTLLGHDPCRWICGGLLPESGVRGADSDDAMALVCGRERVG